MNCRKYRPEIEKFIAVLMERDAQDEERIPDLNLKVNSSGQVNCTQVWTVDRHRLGGEAAC